MASIVELRDMSDEQIEDLVENAQEELFNLRFQRATSQLENTVRIRAVRREVARLNEVLHKRRLAIQEAAQHPEIAQALSGKDWEATARYDYEDSAWRVEFVNEKGGKLASALVNLNVKRPAGRKNRQAQRSQLVRSFEVAG
jgi:large subunit ribosomal protein L29